jgi:methyl acetate hydrolase
LGAAQAVWPGLANTYYWIEPRQRLTGVILIQILPFADPGVLGVFERFERAIYADRAAS